MASKNPNPDPQKADLENQKTLKQFSRIVIKIGSSLLVDSVDGLKEEWLASLLTDVADLVYRGCDVLIVSSGAIALGRQALSLQTNNAPRGSLKLEECQAAAAIGQIALSQVYSENLQSHGIVAAQILLTIDDTERRHRYLNARNTISTALKWKAVPIINENDSVATSEIRYGDNDRLAARVASMCGADLLILLSDVDGLYDSPPNQNSDAKLIPRVKLIDEKIESMAGGAASSLSRGGMKTKIDAAKIATAAGTTMVIASGLQDHPISQLDQTGQGTWFDPAPGIINERKKWIAGGLESAGSITIDAGALIALERGKSLLPAGVTKISGEFSRGDLVDVLGPHGHTVARGLVEYRSDHASAIVGMKTEQVVKKLGTMARSAIIHRNNLVLD